MGMISGVMHRVRVLLFPGAYRREVEQEIRFHLELEAMQQRSAGLAPADANAAAHKQFGNVTYAREERRRMTLLSIVDRVRQDTTYALRSLRQSPTFTIGVALTLGLGLGVNAAMFDFLDRVFVRPPAGVVKPNDVRRLYNDLPRPGRRMAFENFRYPQVRAMARVTPSSSEIGMFTTDKDSTTLSDAHTSMPVQRELANAAYFRVLGVNLAVGRTFDSTEDRIDVRAPVAVISYALWQRMFKADPSVVGTSVRFGREPITIIGVTEKDFSGIQLDRTDLWMPAGNYYISDNLAAAPWYESFHNNFGLIVRIADRGAEQRFLAAASRAYRGVHIEHWEYDSTAIVRSGPIQSALGPTDATQEISIAMRLGGVSLIVLLIALANVSNLLLVRASKRSREIAVRRALGASHRRLFGQFLTESLLLAIVSLSVSAVLDLWASSALRSLLLPTVSWSTSPWNLRSASIVISTTFLVGIVLGIVPALSAWRPVLAAALRTGGARSGQTRSRLSAGLVVIQAALSVVLLVGAGLFVRSLSNVHAVDIGYDVDHTLLVQPLNADNAPAKSLATLMPAVLERMMSIPGVENAASSSLLPMGGESFTAFALPDRAEVPTVAGVKGPSYLDVSPEYFSTIGIRVLAGHVFSESDKSGVVVSESMANGYWPGQSAVGKCIIRDDKIRACIPVIGIVANVNRFEVIEHEQRPRYYVSTSATHNVVALRVSAARAKEISAQLTSEIKAIVPEVTRVRTRTIADMIERQFRPWQLGAILFTAMGVLALMVAAIGVYSVVSYVVSQRKNEMGIRIALGAGVADITRLVVGEGLRTVAIGIAIGVVISMMLASLVASMLYGVSARDPLVMLVAALTLGAIGIAASVVPALRAARVSPMEVLRA